LGEPPQVFDVKVYGAKVAEVSRYVKGEKVLVNDGYLDWYEKGEGAERREFVSIIAAGTPDGIARVPKSEEQESQVNEQAQVPGQAQ
jgi:hypothetical protein